MLEQAFKGKIEERTRETYLMCKQACQMISSNRLSIW